MKVDLGHFGALGFLDLGLGSGDKVSGQNPPDCATTPVSCTIDYNRRACNQMCGHERQLSQAPDCLGAHCLGAQLCSFASLETADVSLTPPLSLWPAAPVMAGPSSSTWDRLQEQLVRLNDLVLAELSKGEHYNQGLVEAYKQEREILGAQIRQTSGDSTMFQRPVHGW